MSKPGTELQLETQNGEQSEHAHGESSDAVTPHISTARQFSPAKVHLPFRLELLAHFILEGQIDFSRSNEEGVYGSIS